MQTNSYFQSYDEGINWLFQQFPAFYKIGEKAYKPTLENTLGLIQLFNLDISKQKFIHVAGTNGKGSVCHFTASILQESGLKTGLFTSPHIIVFTERIKINGKEIPKENVLKFLNVLVSLESKIACSFFEITWVMALWFFIKENVDIIVVETGLGGRLDATNVVQPILSVITNISLDHVNILGNDLQSIAKEKGGIIKENTPVIIGRQQVETQEIFEDIALSRNSELIFASDLFQLKDDSLPDYQQENLNTTYTIFEVLNKKGFNISKNEINLGIQNVFQNTGFFGRLTKLQEFPRLTLDVSHNLDGLKATLSYVTARTQIDTIIYGASNDKNLEEIFPLFPKNLKYCFCEFDNERSTILEVLKKMSEQFKLDADFFESPNLALNHCLTNEKHQGEILMTGSFFLIADFFSKKDKNFLR